MACNEIRSWTFCGLVGAFLDLGLVFLLLCGSTLSFFASKFLGIFGLHLPCPCNGLFGDPHGGKCLQRLLVDYPSRNISSVQMSVMNKFPFDSIWMNDQGSQSRFKLLGGAERCDGPQEAEGETSCSSISDARRTSQNFAVREPPHTSEVGGFGLITSALRDDRSNVKGMRVVTQKPRFGLRRRGRAVAENRKSLSLSFSDPPRFINRQVSRSPCSMSETGHEISEEGSVPMSSARGVAVRDDKEGRTDYELVEESLHDFAVTGSFGESKIMEKDASSAKELVGKVREKKGFDEDEKNVIRVLEQALEEEQAACAALYIELEKERSAAATAADEAMAMILRVQKEKASIEMEAWQYLRMIEEKSAYDAEEMNILKEILVRRETEKHFLEKEVETCRQLILLNNERLEGNVNDKEISAPRSNFSSDSSDHPVPMLQKISESIDKGEIEKNVKTSSSFQAQTVEGPSSFHAFMKELPSSNWDKDANFMKRVDSQRKVSSKGSQPHVPGSCDNCNQEIQEKGMVSMDKELSVLQVEGQIIETVSRLCKLNSPPKYGLLEKTIILFDEGHGQKDNARQCQGVEMKADPNPSGTEINFACDGEELEKHGKNADQGGSDQHISKVETEPILYDVHVIDDRSKLCEEEAREENQARLTDTYSDRSGIHGLPFDPSGVGRIDASTDQPSRRRAATEQDICRSCSDLTAELLPISNIRGKSCIDLQRNSMSAVDNERLKLDTEVGWLTERLRIVQEGREHLSFPMEQWEREKIQLQFLEDIVKQLKEIRQLTEPGKTVRQASVPLTSSKVSTKKRRCRSVSLGLYDST